MKLKRTKSGKIIVKSDFPPFISEMNGKTFTNNWLEVPDGTTLNDLHWVKSDLLQKIHEKKRKINELINSFNGETIIVFSGKKRPRKYEVKVENNKFNCSCAAFKRSSKCKHTKMAFEQIQ